MSQLENRYEIVALVEARMCNPNGDPDMSNRPRVDFETNRGIITDVAFKSRMRNYVLEAYDDNPNCQVLIQNGNSMNRAIAEAVLAANETDSLKKGENKKVKESAEYMCDKYWDVRTFGAVLSTGLNAGQVRGAVQVGMSLSVDPIDPTVLSITRKCYTEGDYSTLAEYDAKDYAMSDDKKRTIGNKAYIPYGLYVVRLTVSANLANKVGFSKEDFNILLEALMQMYNNDASSSKMGMSVLTPLVVFKHVGNDPNNAEQNRKECLLGCAPAYKLFDLIQIERKSDIEVARSYNDYNIKLNLEDLPNGVECGVKRAPYSDIDWFKVRNNIDLLKA